MGPYSMRPAFILAGKAMSIFAGRGVTRRRISKAPSAKVDAEVKTQLDYAGVD